MVDIANDSLSARVELSLRVLIQRYLENSR
jgi:hypothetical protein